MLQQSTPIIKFMDDLPNETPARLLLVDTNCFLRIYYSPLRPFIGAMIGGYRICTLKSLLEEYQNSDRLVREYAWLGPEINRELALGTLPDLLAEQAADVKSEMQQIGPWANRFLERHCVTLNRPPKTLSRRDVELVATAAVFEAVIASDEWPMQLVVEDLTQGDDGYEIAIITSIDVLSILETDGKITDDERRATVREWLRCNEKLPTEWRQIYERLFKEAPPALQ